jgi:hypothetical protein
MEPTTAAIMSAGMKCLRDTLGTVDAEMFIVNIKNAKFDYTEWRQKQPWINAPFDEIVKNAAEAEQAQR